MTRPHQSRGSAATKSADIGSNETSTGSIGTGGKTTNPDAATEDGSSISSIDPADASYFIQYHPELVEKFANEKSSSIPVSARTLSIVFSRMLYWSRYAKWRFGGKLYFWKSQEELGEETGYSTKTINRALKELVSLGLLVREKFHKHYYRQVYFYHIGVSPFTKEIPQGTKGSIRRDSSTSRPSRVSGAHQQRFHSSASVEAPRAPEAPQGSAGAAVPPDAPSGAVGGAGGVRKNRKQRRREMLTVLGAAAVPTARPINPPAGFGRNGSNCPYQSKESQSIKNISLKSIVERCNFIGKYGIETINGRT
jgi:hypothetical protein